MNQNDIYKIEHEVRMTARRLQKCEFRHVYELNGHTIQLDIRKPNSVHNGAEYINKYKIDGKLAARAKVLELAS